MSATLYRKERIILDDKSFISIAIWEVIPSVLGSTHGYKYSLAYIVNNECVLRYDNERGKGDHKHIGSHEMKVTFTTVNALINDFFNDIDKLRR